MEKKYLRENVRKINTIVEEYNLHDNSLHNEFNIGELSLDTLKTIFQPRGDDEELFLAYEVDENQADSINAYLSNPISFNFSVYEYYLQRFGEY